jgi:LysM repeat protein
MVNINRQAAGSHSQGSLAMKKSIAVFSAGASVLALLAAGCATSVAPEAALPDPYAAALYTGAPQPDIADQYSGLYAPEQRSSNGAPFELASYAGIEGARRAHALYTKQEAEALDGRCEASVSPTATESMIDIADLCDVPLETLVEFNPGVADVSYSTGGAVVKIPGGVAAPKGIAAVSDQLVLLDTVQPGDTLDKIAFRLNVSQTTLANLNPDVDWTKPIAGQSFVKPAATPAASAPAYAPPVETSAWEGYAGYGAQGLAGSGAGGVIAHAPYDLTPVNSYGKASGAFPEGKLTVDRTVVNAGGKVVVTAKAAPGGEVTFYSGDNPADMKKAQTVRADDNGEATATIVVKKSSNMGGVVFGAREKGANDTQYSDRVNVVKLDAEGGGANDGE